jgi:hypothetical protein
VRVRKSRFGWLGPILYDERNVYLAAKTGMALDELFPNKLVPVTIRNLVLAAFANAAWHCSTAAEMARLLNDAIAAVRRQG